jgi:site-specific DNA-methyltransferase (adenine-specific)
MQAAYDQGVVVQSQPGMVPRLKRYLDEQEGNPVSDIWADIPPIQSSSAERLGVPAQKPLVLLERMILASSNPGDVVLDPFCGCGTAIAAAQKLDRRWIGITHQAVSLVVNRMRDMFPGCEFAVVGEPGDIGSARHLAQADPTQFCWWACSLVEAIPDTSRKGERTGKQGSGPGIDAIKLFVDDASNEVKQVLIQVKNGPGKCEHLRDLQALLDGEKAALGLFITLEPPTPEMLQEARGAGVYHSQLWNKEYPRLQIVEIADLLQGQRPLLPPSSGAFKKTERVLQRDPKQARLKF